jgi:hypothetical protein
MPVTVERSSASTPPIAASVSTTRKEETLHEAPGGCGGDRARRDLDPLKTIFDTNELARIIKPLLSASITPASSGRRTPSASRSSRPAARWVSTTS